MNVESKWKFQVFMEFWMWWMNKFNSRVCYDEKHSTHVFTTHNFFLKFLLDECYLIGHNWKSCRQPKSKYSKNIPSWFHFSQMIFCIHIFQELIRKVIARIHYITYIMQWTKVKDESCIVHVLLWNFFENTT